MIDLPQLYRAIVKLPLGLMLGSLVTGLASAEEPAEFFHREVEPILRTHCYGCHSHASGQFESGLALDWYSGWAMGGDRGPAIVPGQPEASLLIQAIGHQQPELKMPEERLSDQQIEALTRWVRQGAYDDRRTRPAESDPLDWWSLRPLVSPTLPDVAAPGLAGNPHPIDAFIQQRLRSEGLSPSPSADRSTLIRRLYYDLVGLPPAPQEVRQFEADPRPDAYERLVDQLLASPRYGERWARHWLDTIHFADSHGYEHDVGRDHAWPYRDYVIAALNQDTPWPRFIREQLAADVFYPDEPQLLAALGFLGAGTFDLSTYSTAPVTFDYLDRDDMLSQTMSAFVSSTVQCARCHAHKFDPIPQEDYYALQAVFAGVLKGDILYDTEPEVARQRRQWQSLWEAAERRDASLLLAPASQPLINRWLEQRGTGADWQALEVRSFVSAAGATLTRAPESVILASGTNADIDTYTISGSSSLSRLTAVRLDLLPDPSLPMHGPGRCSNGNLHLSEISLMLFEPEAPVGRPLKLSRASADFNQAGWGVERAIDGNPETAWGIHPAVGQPHHAVFELAEPFEWAAGSLLTVTLRQLHGGSHVIGAFRLSVTDADWVKSQALPAEVEQVLQAEPSARTSEQQLVVAAHAVKAIAQAELAALPEQSRLYAVGREVQIPTGNGKYQPASLAAPKPVHLLQRGEIDKPLGVAVPGGLSVLQQLPARFESIDPAAEGQRRAALADWLADPANVLTWRSAVNRVWHYHFGRGLCDTPGDLGRMGGQPSHPELIDWLAVWFRDQAGGSLKQLHRLIVTSQTYQQSSQHRPDAALVDAENVLWWRQNRHRLDADAYRDFVLAVSGQLDATMGGPAIQQFSQSPGPQATPVLDYEAFDWSAADAQRRSIYRYVWRGIADPLMAALDFPDLGLLSPSREFSASPLQSLALYNNSFVLHHSRAMSQRITAATTDSDQQLHLAVQLTWQRQPSATEMQQLRAYTSRHGLAALCRVLLNSSEFLFVN